MKSILTVIFAFLLSGAIALAQDTTPSSSTSQNPAGQAPSQEQSAQPSNPSPQAPSAEQGAKPNNSAETTPAGAANNGPEAGVKRLAPGSVLPVLLTKSIDAKKAKNGDQVVAKVPQDMKSNSGEIVIAKDTKILGHVTEAQPRSKEQKESQLGIAFDRAVLQDGREMQMPMSIQAIVGPQNNNPNAGNNQGSEDTGAGAASGSSAGSNAGMKGSSRPQTAPTTPEGNSDQGNPQATNKGARPPINGETRGVIGVSNLKLESSPENSTQGSVMTSDKNNVRLDSGTMLLLRVNK